MAFSEASIANASGYRLSLVFPYILSAFLCGRRRRRPIDLDRHTRRDIGLTDVDVYIDQTLPWD
ncbi:MAG: hypothetical protein U1E46_17080 [Hyphomicrobiales bacterium]